MNIEQLENLTAADALNQVTYTLAIELKADNPRFNIDTFATAAGVR